MLKNEGFMINARLLKGMNKESSMFLNLTDAEAITKIFSKGFTLKEKKRGRIREEIIKNSSNPNNREQTQKTTF